MPELPEVETVRRGLEPAMAGVRIAAAEVRRPELRWPLPERMAERLSGRRVLRLRRRSKYILADLDSGESLLIHLGMSGRMTISGEAPGSFHRTIQPLERHDHVVFHMENGARIAFNDARRFGAMDLVASDAWESHPLLRGLGPEPLGNAFDGPGLAAALRPRRTPLKAALLDQRVVAGLGNIYVCEVLHRAGLSPLRRCDRTSGARLAALVPVIRQVLEAAIAAGGASLRDHRQASGELGYFQHDFRAYGREGAPCRTEGCDGKIRRVTQSGRSTFYCPNCQR
ncbi:bifunctional DNA-formamidopyrimidine glycosylase/DNA-(apurinic or apyrimidinic site) lyase [Tropicimonas sp. IMCC6043]|uniref:bifunctional DNA-formamidopyrimidine glycosylase/DNA-(apurinic or apyrimidinic site) lyase n=1 Tax=Tropicimonas sp. IMCC6043 TaxID=2510645 RepID=UPI00101DA1BA|nr:bifunctional DNA-formamidopyrimidine glycosylase/DNA-(apurinic or apyrimidinic site) lyase [Tropicimonas sp. IMCC6043]RYH09212.1 bifunctional DNA-formamidopyrimidine glycosylase/DNA-(apurinic or apyrimidinic site) lyase [Tropicimonas sp. IMCC6043]